VISTALAEDTGRVEVMAVVRDDSLIELQWDGSSYLGWNHEPEAVAATLRRPNAAAEWAPERNLLIVHWDEVIDLQPDSSGDPEWTDRPDVAKAKLQLPSIVAESAPQLQPPKAPERLTKPSTVFSLAPIAEQGSGMRSKPGSSLDKS
jgi:hypothetical protein